VTIWYCSPRRPEGYQKSKIKEQNYRLKIKKVRVSEEQGIRVQGNRKTGEQESWGFVIGDLGLTIDDLVLFTTKAGRISKIKKVRVSEEQGIRVQGNRKTGEQESLGFVI
jgi:hypothetical protein